MNDTAVIYEVNLEVDREILAEYDAWLKAHVAAMLRLPGFLSANILRHEAVGDEASRPRRTVHYKVESREALENYFNEHAARMRQEAVDRFGDRQSASRRVMLPDEVLTEHSEQRCRNCGTELAGQYCAECGQWHRVRLRLFHLLRDGFVDLFEADSRLWRSILPLLSKPGYLTRDYLDGRRVRYLPPFRLYLFISILFFVYIQLDPPNWTVDDSDAPAVGLETDDAAAEDTELSTAKDEALAEVHREMENALTEAGVPERVQVETLESLEKVDYQLHRLFGEMGELTPGERITACDKLNYEVNLSWPWTLTERFINEDRAKDFCRKLAVDAGQAFLGKVVDNISVSLILCLPILALVFKLLYLFSRQYYVAHLLFFIHFHSFAFLLLILYMTVLSAMSGTAMAGGAWLVHTAVWLYLFAYLFVAMRRVYGQSRFITGLKYLGMLLTYFTLGFVVVVLTFIVTALSF